MASGNHEGLSLRGHPPLDPSTLLPPQRILHRRMFHLRQDERPLGPRVTVRGGHYVPPRLTLRLCFRLSGSSTGGCSIYDRVSGPLGSGEP